MDRKCLNGISFVSFSFGSTDMAGQKFTRRVYMGAEKPKTTGQRVADDAIGIVLAILAGIGMVVLFGIVASAL